MRSGLRAALAAITPSVARNNVRATVAVVDETGAPASNAAVTVVITKPGGSQVTQTRTTSASGAAQFSTKASGPGTYTFTVTNVTKPGFTYDASANVETSDSIQL